jgi:hypothetical protein
MGLIVELEPLTECSAAQRATKISAMYNANASRLKADFSALDGLYNSPNVAKRTILNRQAQMKREGAFAVYTVFLGWEPDNEGERSFPMRISGMATQNPHDVPAAKGERLTGRPGLHLAMWLDKNRPPILKQAGIAVMHARIRAMVDNPATEGRPWTLILPTNVASRRAWEHDGYVGGGYETDGTPKVYPSIDRLNERLLYVARFTLDELRAQGASQ